MFVLLWGPTVAAVSVVLDHADAGAIVSTALGGLLHAARIAAFHHVDEVGLTTWTGQSGQCHRVHAAQVVSMMFTQPYPISWQRMASMSICC
jgi:hypothetical protein